MHQCSSCIWTNVFWTIPLTRNGQLEHIVSLNFSSIKLNNFVYRISLYQTPLWKWIFSGSLSGQIREIMFLYVTWSIAHDFYPLPVLWKAIAHLKVLPSRKLSCSWYRRYMTAIHIHCILRVTAAVSDGGW